MRERKDTMRKALLLTTALALALTSIGAATAGKPAKVFEDPAGDAGNQDTGLPGADQAGFDLVGGTIGKVKKNLAFTVEHAAMPSSGTLPEAFRLLWHINVGGDEYRFTVKSFDIGKPDVIGQSGQERVGKVYQGVARLEQCAEEETPAITLINCKVLEYLEAKFDAATKTVTWSLPLKSVKAKVGSLIVGGTTGAAPTCQVCWVPHYAERSLTPVTIIDSAAMTGSYKVPKK